MKFKKINKSKAKSKKLKVKNQKVEVIKTAPNIEDESSDESDNDNEVNTVADPVASNQLVIDGINDKNEKEEDSEEEIEKEPEQHQKKAYDKEDECRTVFVGNIPNLPNVNESRIKDLFRPYGEIKSVRFRSESGKVLYSKKMKKACKCFVAFVVFENEEDAKKSVEMNGHELLDNKLRVNMANNKGETFSNKGTIFVGNLPFECTEHEVQKFFDPIGAIEYVRVIPNKGIAYVCFKKGVEIANAIKLQEQPLNGRKLRIQRCESKDKQDRKKMFKKDPKTGKIMKQKVRKNSKLESEKFLKGKCNNNPLVKKILKSNTARFNKFSIGDQVPKRDLFRSGGQRRQKRDFITNKITTTNQYLGKKIDGINKKSKKNKKSKGLRETKVIAAKLKAAAKRTNVT